MPFSAFSCFGAWEALCLWWSWMAVVMIQLSNTANWDLVFKVGWEAWSQISKRIKVSGQLQLHSEELQ